MESLPNRKPRRSGIEGESENYFNILERRKCLMTIKNHIIWNSRYVLLTFII